MIMEQLNNQGKARNYVSSSFPDKVGRASEKKPSGLESKDDHCRALFKSIQVPHSRSDCPIIVVEEIYAITIAIIDLG